MRCKLLMIALLSAGSLQAAPRFLADHVPTACPLKEMDSIICGLSFAQPVRGVLAISSPAIRRAAVGGASPFLIADDASLWE